MKKKVAIVLVSLSIAFSIVAIAIILSSRKSENANTPNVAEMGQPQENTWPEITTDGVNEVLLLQNVDQDLLEQIAYELQTLVAEASEEERQDPEIVIREGWTRVWQYERYQKVLSIGTPAMKPLYFIIYKSPYAGEYEYLCANILYELSGFDFEWTNSKEFLEKFNQAIIKQKGQNGMNSITEINIVINNQSYLANIEENAAAQAFVQKLPQSYIMQELNGNEKYIYLDYSLPTDSSVPKRINAGDIMLYGDNCLVIFYKTFATSYSYTKIGHIDNLPSLNSDSIAVKFWE